MQICIIGLGKMGYNLALNLKRNLFQVKAYDINAETRRSMAAEGVITVESLKELSGNEKERKIIWLMVPSGKIVDDTITDVIQYLNKGDIIIDGGNSHYKDS